MHLRSFQHTNVNKEGIRGNGLKVPITPSVDVKKPSKKDKKTPYTIVVNEALIGGCVNGVFIIFDDKKEFDKFKADFGKKA